MIAKWSHLISPDISPSAPPNSQGKSADIRPSRGRQDFRPARTGSLRQEFRPPSRFSPSTRPTPGLSGENQLHLRHLISPDCRPSAPPYSQAMSADIRPSRGRQDLDLAPRLPPGADRRLRQEFRPRQADFLPRQGQLQGLSGENQLHLRHLRLDKLGDEIENQRKRKIHHQAQLNQFRPGPGGTLA